MFERTKDTLNVLEDNGELTITGALALFHDICADVKDTAEVSIAKLDSGDEEDFVLSVCRTGRVLLNIIKNQKDTIETAENRADMDAIEEKLQETQEQLLVVKEKIELTKDKRKELEKQRSLYQSEYSEYEKQLKQERQLQEECQNLEHLIEESEELNTEKLIAKKLQLEEQLKQCEMVCGDLKDENRKLQSELEISKDRLREEQVYKQDMNAELAATIKKCEEYSTTSEVLEKSRAEKEREIIILQEQCESKQSQLEKLRCEVLPELQQKISDLDIKLTFQKDEYKKRKMHYDALVNEVSANAEEDENWNRTLEDKRTQVNLLLNQIEQKKKKAEELDDKVKNLGAEQKDLLNRIDASQNAINARDISSLKILCDEKEKELAEVEQKSGELKRRMEILEQSISEGKNNFEIQNGLANSKQVECEALKEKINKEEERKKQLESQYGELYGWLESMHLDKYKDEVEKCRMQVEILETAQANFKTYIWNMPTYAGYVIEDERCEKASLYFGDELTRISNELKDYLHNYNELMNLFKKV